LRSWLEGLWPAPPPIAAKPVLRTYALDPIAGRWGRPTASRRDAWSPLLWLRCCGWRGCCRPMPGLRWLQRSGLPVEVAAGQEIDHVPLDPIAGQREARGLLEVEDDQDAAARVRQEAVGALAS